MSAYKHQYVSRYYLIIHAGGGHVTQEIYDSHCLLKLSLICRVEFPECNILRWGSGTIPPPASRYRSLHQLLVLFACFDVDGRVSRFTLQQRSSYAIQQRDTGTKAEIRLRPNELHLIFLMQLHIYTHFHHSPPMFHSA